MYTGREDFSLHGPSQGPTFRSLSKISKSSTNRYPPKLPLARKLTPPKDHQRSALGKKKNLSLISSSAVPTSPPTPPGSFRTSSPMDIRIYEQMLQEGFSAQRERRAMNFTPICSRERVPMSPKDFWKLYEALNLGEIDYQYVSTDSRGEDSN